MPKGATLFRDVFQAPFRLLPALALALFMALLILVPESPFRGFHPSDPDDFMRLVQARDFLSGQGWFDVGQHRLAPGLPSELHWSRLADLPLAAVTTLGRGLLPLRGALVAAALFWPLAMLALLLVPLVVEGARPLLARGRANLTVAFLFLAAPAVLFNFTPTRVDHHAYQLLIAGFGLWALPRLAWGQSTRRLGLLLGAAFAAGLWIGVEVVPALALFAGGLILVVLTRPHARRAGMAFALALALGTTLVMPLARPVAAWRTLETPWFSATYVLLAWLIAALVVAAAALAPRLSSRAARLGALALMGLAGAGGLFALCPALIKGGPYADVDAANAALLLGHITEAKPLWAALASTQGAGLVAVIARYAFVPSLALGVTVWAAWRTRSTRRRALLLGHALLLAAFFGSALFYQMRLMTFEQLFALPLVTYSVGFLWDRARARWQGRGLFWAEIAVFAAFGLVPVMLVPPLVTAQPLTPARLFFPVLRAGGRCDLTNVAALLVDPEGLGDRPRVILNTINDGPELLYRTPHIVLSAPYGTVGNAESLAFFTATDEDAARAVLRRNNVDLVLLCRGTPAFYAGMTRAKLLDAALSQDARGHLVIRNKKPTLYEKLLDGKPPSWLTPVEVPFEKDYVLLSVVGKNR
jgi:hypothetical protein